MLKKLSILLIGSIIGFSSCNLEKDVNVELPPYESQKILECYLEPGKPFRALLTKSSPYFSELDFSDLTRILASILEDSAKVQIKFGNQTVVLTNTLSLDQINEKVYNYSSTELVPADYTSEFELEIILQDGKTITSRTKISAPVAIDSVKIEFNQERKARALTYISDNSSTKDYYRRMLNLNSLKDSIPEQDFLADDQILQGSTKLVFGSGFQFEKNDTLYNTILHINKDYFDFLSSVKNAVSNNGNPFGQPGVIYSNLQGTTNALGIFTGFLMVRDTSYVR
ncbi:MAG: DUF4249 domain-containing protein [Saprospiraceae bacterium]|nr:DUF4249 domain-containing protein [Saprospiraceae bacterium]